MGCENGCLELSVRCCESLEIQLGLSANVDFLIQINRPGSSRWYVLSGTTDGTGAILIDKTKFPDGFFATGYLKGELIDEDRNPLPFIVDGVQYECFLLEFVDLIEL